MSRVASFKPALTDIDTTAQAELTAICEADNATYKYVKFLGSNTISAGDVVCYVSGSTTLDTVDVASSGYGAGIALAGVTSGGGAQYGFIQIKGVATVRTQPAGSPAYFDPLMTGSAGQVTKLTSVASGSVPSQRVGNYLNSATIVADFNW